MIIEYPKGEEITIDDVFEEKDEVDNLFDSIDKLPKVSKVKPKKERKQSVTTKPKRRTTKRISKDEIIVLEIHDDDDDMVRLIKDTINEEAITMQDIYDHFDSNSDGYNLYYGLVTRSSINYKSALKWCEVINKEFIITIRDKE